MSIKINVKKLQSIILFIYYYTQKTRQLSIAVCKKKHAKNAQTER